jgi:ribosomal protein S18 acetylase RimI-like enzyme
LIILCSTCMLRASSTGRHGMRDVQHRTSALRARYRIRLARPRDTLTVRGLDTLCFPADSLEKQRAAEGELEAGVAAENIWLVEDGAHAVGYLHADTTTQPHQVFVAGLAVHPRWQSRGIGWWLIEACLSSLEPRLLQTTPIVTVTSPRNLAMLRVLFRHGFGARWVLRDYFGPGKDRFGLQLRRREAWTSVPDGCRLTTPSLEEAYRAIEELGLLAKGVHDTREVPWYELSAYDIGDFAPHASLP